MCDMFDKIGNFPGDDMSYLFLGDYVDRGIYGVECCLLLFAMKLANPKKIFCLRGNHESRNMTEMFTFRDEVIDTPTFDDEVYELFMDVFDSLPVAAKVNDEYLCCHGGIGPTIKNTEDINKHSRF